MSLTQKDLQKEQDYLKLVQKLVNEKISKLEKDHKELSESITKEQKEMWQNVGGMDKAEIEFASSDIERSNLQAKYFYQNLNKFKKVYENPYFGRIDFKETDRQTQVYIGLSSVSDIEYNNYVYDWRAPISSLYYDYELGKAFYEAPDGIIEGYINLKRQYKIENGNLDFAFDSSVSIQDEMLKEALSHNSSEKMKDIVTTIQKEQNEVIRNTDYDNLVVEGAAGSGKTSVALHRIAFILYRYRNYINNKNIIIFSPNKVFSEYISEVLPSLGEDNVPCMIFSEFLENQMLEYEDVENYSQLIERYHNTKDNLEKRIMEIKMDNDFIYLVDDYLKRVVDKIKFKDIIVSEELLLSKEECQLDFNETYSRYKPLVKVQKIIDNITNKYKNTHQKRTKGYGSIIKKSVTYNDNIDTLVLEMYHEPEFLKAVSEKYHITEEEFKEFAIKEIKSPGLKYYDGIIYLYIKAKLQGLEGRLDIKYVVVDEAQDYNLMQYYLIREFYSKAKFTILGDPNQAITAMVNYENMNEVKEIIGGKGKLLKLMTTYRSSYEITNFCNAILNLNHVNMINRHSEEPHITNITKEELKSKLETLIEKSIDENLESVAILCENKDIEYQLNELIDINKYKIKLYILPVYSAKGLEFDSVIIYDNGFSTTDLKLYYVACTRALHKLNILKCNN